MKTIALVRFTPKAKKSSGDYKALISEVISICKNVEGLNRKYFVATETGSMGVYVWDSKEIAEAFYRDSEAWNSQMDAMASDTTVEYVQVKALLNNEAETVNFFV